MRRGALSLLASSPAISLSRFFFSPLFSLPPTNGRLEQGYTTGHCRKTKHKLANHNRLTSDTNNAMNQKPAKATQLLSAVKLTYQGTIGSGFCSSLVGKKNNNNMYAMGCRNIFQKNFPQTRSSLDAQQKVTLTLANLH